MAKISGLEHAPGVVATFRIAGDTVETVLAGGGPVAVLAGISDPGNAGTLVRTAEIFGFGGVLFTPDAVEPHNPKAVRATMGAIFRLRVAMASGEAILQAARSHGYAVIAADRSGDPLPGFRFPKRCLIAVGNERHGVGKSLPGGWDRAVAIPHAGAGESLNAAVAGAIIFYAFSQQGEQQSPDPPVREKP
jgi:TrmH family RNA methyltransferase